MINRIHGSHIRQKRLSSANITRGLLTSNVLLSGLKRKPIRHFARRVFGYADKSTGHSTLVLVLDGKEGGVGSAVA
jgi:hypothetical protein